MVYMGLKTKVGNLALVGAMAAAGMGCNKLRYWSPRDLQNLSPRCKPESLSHDVIVVPGDTNVVMKDVNTKINDAIVQVGESCQGYVMRPNNMIKEFEDYSKAWVITDESCLEDGGSIDVVKFSLYFGHEVVETQKSDWECIDGECSYELGLGQIKYIHDMNFQINYRTDLVMKEKRINVVDGFRGDNFAMPCREGWSVYEDSRSFGRSEKEDIQLRINKGGKRCLVLPGTPVFVAEEVNPVVYRDCSETIANSVYKYHRKVGRVTAINADGPVIKID